MGAMADIMRGSADAGGAVAAAPRVSTLLRQDPQGGDLINPFAEIPKLYKEEIAGAKEELGAPGVWPKISGILRYGLSPIRAVSHALVSDPVERLTGSKTAGEYAGIGAELAIPGIGFTRLPGYTRHAAEAGQLASTRALPVLKETEDILRTSEPALEREPLLRPTKPLIGELRKNVTAEDMRVKVAETKALLKKLQSGADDDLKSNIKNQARKGAGPAISFAETRPGYPRLEGSSTRTPKTGESLSVRMLPEGAPVGATKAESGIRNAAGNINLDYISEPKHIQEVLLEASKSIPLERVSNAETIRAAKELGLTEGQLLSRRGSQALNPQQLIAARDLLVDSARRVTDLAARAVGGGDDAVLSFKQAIDRHTAIQSQVSGATALTGRALQSFRIAVNTPRAIKRALDELGGKAGIEEMAQAIKDLGDPEKAAKFIQAAPRKGFRRGIVEFWVNSILSGPKTHAANIIGNSFTSLLQVPEEAVAAGLQATRAFGKGGEQLTQRGVAERAYGLLSGVTDGLRAAGIALRKEGVDQALSKVEHQPAIPGKIGKIVRIPGRLLGAEDEFFKTINYRAELRSQAANMAKAEGVKGSGLAARIGEILDNPTDEMLTAATRHADLQTFTKAGGPFVKSLQALKSDVPEVSFIIPFLRTPTNLMKYAIARTPAAALMPSAWAEFASGPAGKARVTSRILTGGALQAWFYSLASHGLITGHGPESKPARESLMASGWRPYSVKVGDEYVSYRRGDPLSYMVGMMADAQHLKGKQGEDLTGAALAALTENLTDKTFFKGITDLAMTIEYKNPEYLAKQIVGGFIPSALNQIRQAVDPVYRETESVGEALMNRIPGLSSGLEPKRDVFGAEIPMDPALGPDVISPLTVSRESTDPVRKLLGEGVVVGKPSKTISGKGLPKGGVDLGAKEYSWLVRKQGETAKKLLDRVVRNQKFRRLDTEDQQVIVNRILDLSRLPFRTKLKDERIRALR